MLLAGMLDALRQADARVAAVAWRLQTANTALCRDVAPLPGFSVDTLDQYAVAQRDAARAQLGLGDLPQVSAVAPGSAAAAAGLRVGDEILAVDDVPMPRSIGSKASYDRTAEVEAALAKGLAGPPLKLTLRSRTILLSGDAGCVSTVQLVPEGRYDATADGRYVQISGPLYRFAAKDDELAFLIAHELAHNVVPDAKRAPKGRGRLQRAAELAADKYAVRMMARAGYDVATVVPLLQRLSRSFPSSWFDTGHPGWTVRIAAATEEVATAEKTRPLQPQ
jgi:hypothetical protein